MLKIAGAGIACLDHIVVSPQVPWGDTSLVSRYSVQPGGLVAMALIACSRLGADCRILTALGDDETGDLVARELCRENVDVSGAIRVAGGSTPFSFVHVDDKSGERTIFHRSGIRLAEKSGSADTSAIDGRSVLIVDDIYPELSISAARHARELGIPVVADMIPNDANKRILPHVDILIAPRHFLRQTRDPENAYAATDIIHSMGPTTAVITLGSDGYVWSHAGRKGAGSAFSVDAVDTTGAGDVFHGAFAYAVARKWDIPKCAEFASAVSGFKCTGTGPAALPSLDQTIAFLVDRGRAEWQDMHTVDL